jgi:hypothetical protein
MDSMIMERPWREAERASETLNDYLREARLIEVSTWCARYDV